MAWISKGNINCGIVINTSLIKFTMAKGNKWAVEKESENKDSLITQIFKTKTEMSKEKQVEYFLTSLRHIETKMLCLNSNTEYGWTREKVRKGLRHEEIKVESRNRK